MDSVLNQTYKNIEVILVNDGSPDNSQTICEEYKRKDSRVKSYHKKNGGIASARNFGYKHACGEYILFIDSDDYIEKHMIEILLKNCKNTNSDISVCGFTKVIDHNAKKSKINNNSCILLNRKEAFNYMITNNNFNGYVWNKLYSIKILKKLQNNLFNDYLIEDFEFNSRCIDLCDKICYVEDELYFYYINPNGLTGVQKISERKLLGIDAYNAVLNVYDYNNIEVADLVAYHAFKYQLNINYLIYKNNEKNNCLNYALYRRIINSKKISFSKKTYIYISFKFPIFTSKLKKIFKKYREVFR